ncbi:MAG: pyridoxal-dependent decarboxylase [Candidatus Jorgensenbacteria bacterium]|nr:pyridoxal-dependent decarboxylase [Candidatus Jorgensenbacteria bacterium]
MLWRERKVSKSERKGIVVLHSFLFHYSSEKAFGQLLGDADEPTDERRGVVKRLPTNEQGELTPEILEKCILQYSQKGYRRFAVFLTAGTINFGSIDQIGAINTVLERLQRELGITVTIHVDAAFGGFVIPFVEPNCHFAFQNSLVNSISLDAHKTGGIPYSAGIFLCRKGLLEYTKTAAPYIFGHEDYTVPGSRSGAIAAACWATFQHYGYEGYASMAAQCMNVRNYLTERFQKIPGVITYPSRVNILTVRFQHLLDENLRIRYCIVPCTFPIPLSRKERDGNSAFRGHMAKAYRFALMPHVTTEHIDKFFHEWRKQK